MHPQPTVLPQRVPVVIFVTPQQALGGVESIAVSHARRMKSKGRGLRTGHHRKTSRIGWLGSAARGCRLLRQELDHR